MSEAMVVMCTCPDEAVASVLARGLVRARLAACVNILPSVRSIYAWQGEMCDENETMMVIKSTLAAYPQLEAWLLEHHPYDVPEVVALPTESVAPGYLSWLQKSISV